MKHIKLFEAFASKSVSAIEKFLEQLDKEDRDDFVDILKSISEKTDIPLSNFKGDYIKAVTAIKMNVESGLLVKFWFSIENGFLGMTTTKSFNDEQLAFRKYNHEEDWMKTAYIQNFIINNVLVNRHLNEIRWTERSYKEIMSSQFALVINLTELSSGLKDLKAKRKENKKGALKLSSDEYIRLDNDRRRKDILRKKRGISRDDVLDFMMSLVKKYRCYDPMDIIDCSFELYYRKKIDKDMLDAVMDELEERYGDRMGGFGGGFGGPSRRFGGMGGYGYGDPWGGNRRGGYDNYGYDDF